MSLTFHGLVIKATQELGCKLNPRGIHKLEKNAATDPWAGEQVKMSWGQGGEAEGERESNFFFLLDYLSHVI